LNIGEPMHLRKPARAFSEGAIGACLRLLPGCAVARRSRGARPLPEDDVGTPQARVITSAERLCPSPNLAQLVDTAYDLPCAAARVLHHAAPIARFLWPLRSADATI
jgi:hypothetical protein